jgi:hypothetical protein
LAFPRERTERAATVNPLDSIDARLEQLADRLAAFDARIAADLSRLATMGAA